MLHFHQQPDGNTSIFQQLIPKIRQISIHSADITIYELKCDLKNLSFLVAKAENTLFKEEINTLKNREEVIESTEPPT